MAKKKQTLCSSTQWPASSRGRFVVTPLKIRCSTLSDQIFASTPFPCRCLLQINCNFEPSARGPQESGYLVMTLLSTESHWLRVSQFWNKSGEGGNLPYKILKLWSRGLICSEPNLFLSFSHPLSYLLHTYFILNQKKKICPCKQVSG